MKAINDEDRKAQVGKYLRAEHFTGGVISLYLVKVSQEERESKNTGKMYSQNVYEFLDQDREDKIFTSFLDDAFWKAFAKADPEVGQLMNISAEEVAQNVYIWTIELGKEIIDVYAEPAVEKNGEEDAAALAGMKVVEDGKKAPVEEDPITLEDLPEIFK
ncbi:MAG: hypothetical protein WC248_05875 [Candidatus Methanomethylophilaceae archaeon]|jgi:hypothetical protein